MSEGARFIGLTVAEIAEQRRREDLGLPSVQPGGLAEGSGDFSIGGGLWPGLSKLIEECGEVIQVCGKFIGSAGHEDHWDGSNLRLRLESEIADLRAAIDFVVRENGLDGEVIDGRARNKSAMFARWHGEKVKP